MRAGPMLSRAKAADPRPVRRRDGTAGPAISFSCSSFCRRPSFSSTPLWQPAVLAAGCLPLPAGLALARLSFAESSFPSRRNISRVAPTRTIVTDIHLSPIKPASSTSSTVHATADLSDFSFVLKCAFPVKRCRGMHARCRPPRSDIGHGASGKLADGAADTARAPCPKAFRVARLAGRRGHDQCCSFL